MIIALTLSAPLEDWLIALRIERDGLFGAREPIKEQRDGARRQAADLGDAFSRKVARGSERRLRVAGVLRDEGFVRCACAFKMRQQAVEQHGVAAGAQGQMQIGEGADFGAAGVDHDHAHRRVARLRRRDALIEHGMAPGGVGADEDDQLRLLQILVVSRHDVGAEGALVASDGGGHAEARVGVDIGCADEALGELVDDVIILRQQLTRDIEGDGVGPIFGDRARQAVGDARDGLRPGDGAAVDARLQQAVFEAEGLGKRRALRAQAAEIGGMLGIAAHRRVVPNQNAAADAAIGAGRLGCAHSAAMRLRESSASLRRPASTVTS